MTSRCWMNDGISRWPSFPRIARGLLVALAAGVALIGSGSVVMTFEAAADDAGKPAAKPGDQKPGPNSKKAAASEKNGKAKAAGKNAAEAATRRRADDPGPTGPLPERPARVVTPPTLTSAAELDRMIAGT